MGPRPTPAAAVLGLATAVLVMPAPARGAAASHDAFAESVSGATASHAGPAAPGRPARRRRRRPGCGQFCQQAGGLGGEPALAPIVIGRGPLRVRAGSVHINVRCRAASTCRGALAVFPTHVADTVAPSIPPGSYGGVDLAAPPGRTVSIEIPLATAAQRLITRRGSISIDVLAELRGNPIQARDRHMRVLAARRR